MLAPDLTEPYPSVSTDDNAVDAARLLVEHKLPALLVVDSDQRHALMARTDIPMVAVIECDGDQARLAGAITAARLLERLIGGS
ncbi:CBS domain-containing protein [Streptomyces sp. NBC_00210]|uniref:CBS domain-containing protein n=1 Tax=Streptomyces sp. NBC_00210 TaxID=2903636 RepID=UPI0032457E95